MADWDFKHLLFSLLIFSGISILFLMAVQYQAAEYGKDTSEILAGSLSIGAFNESIANVEASSQTMREQFEKQNPFSVLAGIIITGLFDITKTMTALIISPFTLLGGVLESASVPSFIVSLILAILIMAIIFGVWEVITSKN